MLRKLLLLLRFVFSLEILCFFSQEAKYLFCAQRPTHELGQNLTLYKVPFSRFFNNMCTSGRLSSLVETTTRTRWPGEFGWVGKHLGNFVVSFHRRSHSAYRKKYLISASYPLWHTEPKCGHLHYGWSISSLRDRLRNEVIRQSLQD